MKKFTLLSVALVFLLLSLRILGDAEEKLEIGDMVGDLKKIAAKCHKSCSALFERYSAIFDDDDKEKCVKDCHLKTLNKLRYKFCYKQAEALCNQQELLDDLKCSKAKCVGDLIIDHYQKAVVELMKKKYWELKSGSVAEEKQELKMYDDAEEKLEIGDMVGDINKMAAKCRKSCGDISNEDAEMECVKGCCFELFNKYHYGVINIKAKSLYAQQELFGNVECSEAGLINAHYDKVFLALMMQEERKLASDI